MKNAAICDLCGAERAADKLRGHRAAHIQRIETPQSPAPLPGGPYRATGLRLKTTCYRLDFRPGGEYAPFQELVPFFIKGLAHIRASHGSEAVIREVPLSFWDDNLKVLLVIVEERGTDET